MVPTNTTSPTMPCCQHMTSSKLWSILRATLATWGSHSKEPIRVWAREILTQRSLSSPTNWVTNLAKTSWTIKFCPRPQLVSSQRWQVVAATPTVKVQVNWLITAYGHCKAPEWVSMAAVTTWCNHHHLTSIATTICNLLLWACQSNSITRSSTPQKSKVTITVVILTKTTIINSNKENLPHKRIRNRPENLHLLNNSFSQVQNMKSCNLWNLTDLLAIIKKLLNKLPQYSKRRHKTITISTNFNLWHSTLLENLLPIKPNLLKWRNKLNLNTCLSNKKRPCCTRPQVSLVSAKMCFTIHFTQTNRDF